MIKALIFFLIVGIVLLICMYIEKDNKPKNIRNYKVRFEARNNKYYIVNETVSGDVPIRSCFGLRMFYDNKIEADTVAERLNS